MWFVMEHDVINMNQVSSISILYGGAEAGKEWQKVCLRYVKGAASYQSDDSDVLLFTGTLEECKVFLREFKNEMLANRVFYLDNIKQAVESTSNVR